MHDEVPSDGEILGVIDGAECGLTPGEIFQALEAEHSRENIIRGIQRVLDRGLVELTDGARLIRCKEHEDLAA